MRKSLISLNFRELATHISKLYLNFVFIYYKPQNMRIMNNSQFNNNFLFACDVYYHLELAHLMRIKREHT